MTHLTTRSARSLPTRAPMAASPELVAFIVWMALLAVSVVA